MPSYQAVRAYFDNLQDAYAAAGRDEGPDRLARATTREQALSVRMRFQEDVCSLLQQAGVKAEIRPWTTRLVVNGVEVIVRIARQLPSTLAPRWLAGNVTRHRSAERWLLVMRLNSDGLTGKDFFLLSPEEARTFTGKFNDQSLAQYAGNQVLCAEGLVERLSQIQANQQDAL